MAAHTDPTPERPAFPKGYQVPQDLTNVLPWSYARERLEQAQNYWVCTASASGKPHAMPLWGAWVDDHLFFEGHPFSRWARNLAANPQVTIHLENGNHAVSIDGTAEDVIDVGPALYERVTDVYAAKYNGYRPQDHGFFVFTPRVAFGWTEFLRDPTRWRFTADPKGLEAFR